MKKLLIISAISLCTIVVNAQSTSVKFAPIDASPLDVAYYPQNATKVKGDAHRAPIVKVIYSRPAKKGREIFGVLEQYNKIWRLGANENTEIDFNRPVTVGKTKVKPGRYSLFAIPNKEKWTLILNKQTDRWGAFSYDIGKDVARIEVPTQKLDKVIEVFSIGFTDADQGANMVMAWDKTQVSLPIIFKK